MPSQVYKDYTKSMMQQARESGALLNDTAESAGDHAETQGEGNTGQVDLLSLWQEHEYHEISSDQDSDDETGQEETQDPLSSIMRPSFPKTPAMAGQKRTYRGDPISANSVKTPGSGLSAFVGIGDRNAMSATQMFQVTQTPSSPIQDMAPTDAIFTRPSPNINHSSPALHFSSPTKTPNGIFRAITEPRDMYMSMKESQEERKRRLLEMQRLAGRSSSGIARGTDEDDDEEDSAEVRQVRKREHARISSNALHAWNHIRAPERPGSRMKTAPLEIPETPDFARVRTDKQKEVVELNDDAEKSHDDDSLDEYDEFAQDIRPSQRQATASPSHQGSQDEQPAALPQEAATDLDAQEQHNMDDITVADSQPHGQETQHPPGTMDPSSMNSVVPGSQFPVVASQARTKLNTVEPQNSEVLQSEAPRQASNHSAGDFDQERLPSSPPKLSAACLIDDRRAKESRPASDEYPSGNGHHTEENAHGSEGSPQLPALDADSSKELKSSRPTPLLHSSTVPETDPVEENDAKDENKSAPTASAGMATRQRTLRESNSTSLFETAATHFSGSQSRLNELSQARSSRQVSESPRKAAGIRRFTDIATDPTPPDAAHSIDMDFEILNTEDQNFLNVMSSPVSEPVAKRPRVYGKKSKRANADKVRAEASPVRIRVVPQEDKSRVDGNAQEDVPETVRTPKKKEIPKHVQVSLETVVREQAHAPSLVAEQAKTLPENDASTNQDPERDLQHNPSLLKPTKQIEDGSAVRTALATHTNKTAKITNDSVVKGRLIRPKQRGYGKRASRAPSSLASPKKSRPEVAETTQQPSHAPNTSVVHVEPARLPNVMNEQNVSTVLESIAPKSAASKGAPVASPMESARVSDKEVICPERVFALFKGTAQAYYPATCLGAATLDGQKLRIRFDDGTVTQLDAMHVRRLEFRCGDQVKVDLSGFRNKVYIVMGFSNKLDQFDKDSFSKTDIYGFATLQLTPKDRDSTLSQVAAGQAATLSIPSTHIYLTQTMWIRFDDRTYLSPLSAEGGHSSRVQTPVPDLSAPTTPISRARRMTLLSGPPLTHTAIPSPAASRHGVFAGMAFAVSYSTDEKDRTTKLAEKNRILSLIQEHGGLILDGGFQDLFDVIEVADSDNTGLNTSKHRPSPAPTDDSTDTTDALSLTPQAKSLGFVALIADKHSRRAKYVQALALSLPCLAGRWIIDSVNSGAAVPWPRYLLPAGESMYLSGAIRSRTLTPFNIVDAKLADIFRNREKLLQGGRVLLVGQGGKAKWEARKAYAFLTIALGATVVRRVGSLDVAKKIIEQETEVWKWIYVDGRVDEAEKILFGGVASATKTASKKRKRIEGGFGDGKEKTVAGNGNVKIVGDEFVVQSLILGSLIEE